MEKMATSLAFLAELMGVYFKGKGLVLKAREKRRRGKMPGRLQGG